MLYTIFNYKKLFLFFIKNNFSETLVSDGNSKNDEGKSGFLEKNGTKMDDLVDAMLKDGKINGKDEGYIKDLIESYNKDRVGTYEKTSEKTKQAIIDITKEILLNGYSIKDVHDLIVLKNMMIFSGEKLPENINLIGKVITKEINGSKIYIHGTVGFLPNQTEGYIENGKYTRLLVSNGNIIFNSKHNDNQVFNNKLAAVDLYTQAKNDRQNEKIIIEKVSNIVIEIQAYDVKGKDKNELNNAKNNLKKVGNNYPEISGIVNDKINEINKELKITGVEKTLGKPSIRQNKKENTDTDNHSIKTDKAQIIEESKQLLSTISKSEGYNLKLEGDKIVLIGNGHKAFFTINEKNLHFIRKQDGKETIQTWVDRKISKWEGKKTDATIEKEQNTITQNNTDNISRSLKQIPISGTESTSVNVLDIEKFPHTIETITLTNWEQANIIIDTDTHADIFHTDENGNYLMETKYYIEIDLKWKINPKIEVTKDELKNPQKIEELKNKLIKDYNEKITNNQN